VSPNVYIIAGPNGAGKTTFAREFLPNYADSKHFINADLIAQGFAPLAPETVAVRAGRVMLTEIVRFMKQGIDFGFETTLSGRSYLKLIHRLKEHGYQIQIYFLWLPNVRLALSRVRGRVMEGDHDIPASDVRRRFSRSISNFFLHYRQSVDSWILFDASGPKPRVIASQIQGKICIIKRDPYDRLIHRYEEKK